LHRPKPRSGAQQKFLSTFFKINYPVYDQQYNKYSGLKFKDNYD